MKKKINILAISPIMVVRNNQSVNVCSHVVLSSSWQEYITHEILNDTSMPKSGIFNHYDMHMIQVGSQVHHTVTSGVNIFHAAGKVAAYKRNKQTIFVWNDTF